MTLQDAFPRAYVIASWWGDYEVGCLREFLTAEQVGRINLDLKAQGIACMWCQTYDKPEEAN